MNIVMDPVNIVNIVLCAAILIVGIMAYMKTRNPVPMLVAIAFGLFGVSHVVVFLGLHDSWEISLIVIRLAAYLIVVDAMFHSLLRSRKKEQ